MATSQRRRRDRELDRAADAPAQTLMAAPTHDEIASRAYELYEKRGGGHGEDWEDWFRAERELRGAGRDDLAA